MSYSIYYHRIKATIIDKSLCFDENGNKKPFIFESTDVNITSNLCKMFNFAYNCEYWCDKIEKKKGSFVVKATNKAILRLIKYKKKAERFNSPNGWGTYQYALEFLQDLVKVSELYKNNYLEIDK